MRLIGRRDGYGLMNGGRAAAQMTLHGSDARRGMAKHGGQLRRFAEKPGPAAGPRARDPKGPQS